MFSLLLAFDRACTLSFNSFHLQKSRKSAQMWTNASGKWFNQIKKNDNLEWSICMYDCMHCYQGKQSPCLLSCLITGSSFTTVLLKVNMSWVYYHYNVYSYQTGNHDILQGLNIILWEINLGILYEALCQSIYLHGPYQAASLKWSPLIYSLCFLRNAHSSAQDFSLLHL